MNYCSGNLVRQVCASAHVFPSLQDLQPFCKILLQDTITIRPNLQASRNLLPSRDTLALRYVDDDFN